MDREPLGVDELGALVDRAAEHGIAVTAMPEVRREDTRTPDGTVSSLVWGIGPPEIVLVHGEGLDAHSWDAVVLSLGRAALAIDLPGHGRSSRRDDGRYEPRRMAPAVARVVERLANDATMIVGQSLGGLTAVALADLLDDLVARQVLVDALPAVGDAAALWPSIEAYSRPLTLVRALRGWISDDQVAELARRRPTADLVEIDAGHDVQVDDPVGLAGILADRPGR